MDTICPAHAHAHTAHGMRLKGSLSVLCKQQLSVISIKQRCGGCPVMCASYGVGMMLAVAGYPPQQATATEGAHGDNPFDTPATTRLPSTPQTTPHRGRHRPQSATVLPTTNNNDNQRSSHCCSAGGPSSAGWLAGRVARPIISSYQSPTGRWEGSRRALGAAHRPTPTPAVLVGARGGVDAMLHDAPRVTCRARAHEGKNQRTNRTLWGHVRGQR